MKIHIPAANLKNDKKTPVIKANYCFQCKSFLYDDYLALWAALRAIYLRQIDRSSRNIVKRVLALKFGRYVIMTPESCDCLCISNQTFTTFTQKCHDPYVSFVQSPEKRFGFQLTCFDSFWEEMYSTHMQEDPSKFSLASTA
jgi:hypothetical protein